MNPYRILEGGLLSLKYKKGVETDHDNRLKMHPSWIKPLNRTAYKLIEKFEKETESFGPSPVQFAGKWLLEQSAIPSIIVGANRPDQIKPFLSI